MSAIAKLKDETAVTLKGTLLKHLNEDHYEFSDGTGVILLDIDDDLWKASNIKAGDKVQVVGEVDTHRYKPTDIEVVKIEKVLKLVRIMCVMRGKMLEYGAYIRLPFIVVCHDYQYSNY